MLYNVRYEIASSEMMESNMGDLEKFITNEFRKMDPEDSGELSIRECETALQRCKQLNLTPL